MFSSPTARCAQGLVERTGLFGVSQARRGPRGSLPVIWSTSKPQGDLAPFLCATCRSSGPRRWPGERRCNGTLEQFGSG